MTQESEKELRAASDRIEVLMGELAALGPAVEAKTEELLRLLLSLYGGGLERILATIDEAGAAGLLFPRLTADDLVRTLLLLHGLEPAPPAQLVQIGGNGGRRHQESGESARRKSA